MNLAGLVEAAAAKMGTAKALAASMHTSPSRLSEWKKQERKPDAAEIAYMAKVAGLPVLITVAMIEAELHPETAPLWHAALGELEGAPDPRRCQNRALLKRKPGSPAGFFSGRRGCAARYAVE